MDIVAFYDDIFLAHHEWGHPERPERLHTVRQLLQEGGLGAKTAWGEVRSATMEMILTVHDVNVWRRVQALSAQGGGRIDADTYVNGYSLEAACYAAGAAVQAMEATLAGKLGVALVRPPGHHATVRHSMGFCLFNNIAVAAYYARTKGVGRVLILDWDVHHGNGTQDIFYNDPHVMVISLHQHGIYPGTGYWEEMGRGDGYGTTLNIPLYGGAGDAAYQQLFDQVVIPAITAFDPDLILLSAGFDAHWRDPLAQMRLTIAGYHTLATDLQQVARAVNAPIAVVLEGGYDVEAVAYGLYATLLGLLGHELSLDPIGPGPQFPMQDVSGLVNRIKTNHPLLG